MPGDHGPMDRAQEPSDALVKGPRSGRAVGMVPRGAVDSRRCRATNSKGEPCKKWAIVGGTVCDTHGGSSPQVRAAAMTRIQQFAPRALVLLEEIAADPGQPASARVRALVDLLDRGGYKVPEEHVLIAASAPRADLDEAIATALAQRGLLGGQAADEDPSDPEPEA